MGEHDALGQPGGAAGVDQAAALVHADAAQAGQQAAVGEGLAVLDQLLE